MEDRAVSIMRYAARKLQVAIHLIQTFLLGCWQQHPSSKTGNTDQQHSMLLPVVAIAEKPWCILLIRLNPLSWTRWVTVAQQTTRVPGRDCSILGFSKAVKHTCESACSIYATVVFRQANIFHCDVKQYVLTPLSCTVNNVLELLESWLEATLSGSTQKVHVAILILQQGQPCMSWSIPFLKVGNFSLLHTKLFSHSGT